MLDTETGEVSFFRDGQNLGIAFTIDLASFEEAIFYPILQIKGRVNLSVFHPFVYPLHESVSGDGSFISYGFTGDESGFGSPE